MTTVQQATCPSWCVYPGKCGREHMGKAHGTVATGGLPPEVDSPDAPSYDTAVVKAQWGEAVDLPPGVALFGRWNDRDWQVDLTVREARTLLERADGGDHRSRVGLITHKRTP